MFDRVFHELTRQRKLLALKRVLSRYRFDHPDIGSLNDAQEIDAFVLSMPKSGTTAIQKGFERLGRKVLHAHNNHTTYSAYKDMGRILNDRQLGLEDVIKYKLIKNTKPLYIFFGYRDPVSWYLSLAGQFNLALDADLRANIQNNIRDGWPWSEYAIRDTLTIIEKSTQINIWQHTFDRKKGYTIINSKNASLIIYRFDLMHQLQAPISEQIAPGFELPRARVNSDSAYINYAQQFKLPRDILFELFAGRFFDYFYSPTERDDLIIRYADDPSV